ncbi:MAG: hypothetical protein IJS08_15395 [Victivallales bacterium]|nr:hypothetical protein [Victivallales bacterium]
MSETDKTLEVLIARKQRLQEAYDALIAEPESYSISGSVSATNQKLATLREEIAKADAAIEAYLAGGNGVMRRSYPRYREIGD